MISLRKIIGYYVPTYVAALAKIELSNSRKVCKQNRFRINDSFLLDHDLWNIVLFSLASFLEYSVSRRIPNFVLDREYMGTVCSKGIVRENYPYPQ